MRSSHPDAFLLPILLPIFLIGMFPLLFIFLVGFFLGVGILGLLILFIAVGEELTAVGVFDQRVITQDDVSAAERAGYQMDLRSALHPAFLMKIAGAAMVVVGFGGWFCFG